MTEKQVWAEALKYPNRTAFKAGSQSAYRLAKKNKWEHVFSHMEKVSSRFTEQYVLKTVRKFKTKPELLKTEPAIFNAIRKLDRQTPGFKEKCFKHMKVLQKKYTPEEVAAIARSFQTPQEFIKKNFNAYQVASRLNRKNPGFLKQICAHMTTTRSAPRTRKELIDIAKSFTTIPEFREKDFLSYRAVLRYDKEEAGFFKKACSHMPKEEERSYSEEELLKLAKKFKTRAQFRLSNESAYNAALKFNKKNPGFLDKIFSHTVAGCEQREKKSQDQYYLKLKSTLKTLKTEFTIHRELSIPIRDNKPGRVDFFIELPSQKLCLAIEYKHDLSKWDSGKIKKQVSRYNRSFRGRKGFIGTYVVSPQGKYGLSEDNFLTLIKEMINKKGAVKAP